MRRLRAHPALLAGIAALLLSAVVSADTLDGPECRIYFPSHARDVAERILETLPRRRAQISRWLGIPVSGKPRIYLVDDYDGMVARAGAGAPPWAIAVTRNDDLLVFRLDRVNRTPATSLDLVLKHELVHQSLNHLRRFPYPRALPRWFEEGLCVHHAGIPYVEADTSVERMAAAGHLPGFAEADELFARDGNSSAIAYRYGEAAVNYFMGRFGNETLRRLLQSVAQGRPFDVAFRETTGVELNRFEEQWREEVTPSVPFLLYLLLENIELTLLCFGAFVVAGGYLAWRLRREREMRRLDEGGGASPPSPRPPPLP